MRHRFLNYFDIYFNLVEFLNNSNLQYLQDFKRLFKLAIRSSKPESMMRVIQKYNYFSLLVVKSLTSLIMIILMIYYFTIFSYNIIGYSKKLIDSLIHYY